MIRFLNGQPQSIWYSQHEYGQAFSYSSVTKAGSRPIAYSARGSHANYASDGGHDLHFQGTASLYLTMIFHLLPENKLISHLATEIPAHLVWDNTSRGMLWDPILSSYFYTYENKSKEFKAVGKDTPVDWLKFAGRWGDQEYPMEKKGQESFHGFKKWTSGPQGPWFKHCELISFTVLPIKEGIGSHQVFSQVVLLSNASTDFSCVVDRKEVCWPNEKKKCTILDKL